MSISPAAPTTTTTTTLLIEPSLFKNVEIAKQIDDYTCAICNTLCRDAVESSCAHLFCEVCIEKWLEKKACAECAEGP